MTCETVFINGQPAGFACTRGRRRSKCSVRGCLAHADYQCDAPVAAAKKSGICDRYLCTAHRTPQRGSPGVDFCPEHAQAAAERLQQQISLALEAYPGEPNE